MEREIYIKIDPATSNAKDLETSIVAALLKLETVRQVIDIHISTKPQREGELA